MLKFKVLYKTLLLTITEYISMYISLHFERYEVWKGMLIYTMWYMYEYNNTIISCDSSEKIYSNKDDMKRQSM